MSLMLGIQPGALGGPTSILVESPGSHVIAGRFLLLRQVVYGLPRARVKRIGGSAGLGVFFWSSYARAGNGPDLCVIEIG